MNYKLIYDKPGRLRIRCGQYAFDTVQGYGITALLRTVSGVREVFSTPANGGILITYIPGSRDAILSAVSALDRRNLPAAQQHEDETTREIDTAFQDVLSKMLLRRILIRYFAPRPLCFVITLCRSFSYLRRGIRSLSQGRLDVEVLDAASVVAAISQGDLKTAGSIMFLLNISSVLADYTHRRAYNALTQSLAVNIDWAWLVKDGVEVSAPLSDLKVGDTICVRTGSMIPVDGEVVGGAATVNEASMTGEPLAVNKQQGASVYAGTVIEEGTLQIRIRSLTSDARISQIVGLIDRSEQMKADVQSRGEHLADSIVPFSFLGFFGTLLLTQNVTKALSVLMVDYSCAIKLSTPICVISAMREAATNKILVKGGKFLEAYAAADTIVFDKTGTLTNAVPSVAKVLTFDRYGREDVLRIAACLEEHFPHSVAKAIVGQAESELLRHPEDHAEVEYIVAHGIVSRLYDERVLVGSGHFVFEDEKIPLPEEYKTILAKEITYESPIYVAMGGKLIGAICIDDPPRREAATVISALREMGFSRLVMLTGDSESAAKNVCEKLGITECFAQVLPEEKYKIIEGLKAEGHIVVMVGDGINDSPALACANVSVSMKDSSDIAREVADVTLLSNQLDELVQLRVLSTALMCRIQNNYRFILSFNTVLLGMGVMGVLAPATSAWLHNVSTMLVAGMSMRPLLKS